MKLKRFYRVAADNAQARNVDKSWDYYFWCMTRIDAWEDWINRKRRT